MATALEHGTAAIVVAAPTLALLFTFWPFGVAFIASCVALIYVASTSLADAVKNVVGSTLIGGSLSQVSPMFVLPLMEYYYPTYVGIATRAEIPMTAVLAIVIGLLTQRMMPKILLRIERLIDG